MLRSQRCAAFISIGSMLLYGCGGGAGGSSAPPPTVTPPPAAVYTPPAAENLTTADVQQVIAQAVAEAQARGTPAVIAVTDRVGNVLAVYNMVGAPSTITLRPGPGGPAGQVDLQSAVVPAALGAIAKAITGAYLSSGGNAFSTRTASEIVQTTFPPGPASVGLGSGPLFGVQFSQLPCSDLEVPIYLGTQGLASTIGPKPSPLGLAGDPGGFPLYKNGVLVGGVGVKATTDYGFDPDININNPAQVSEESIALAGTVGFDAPSAIRADQITVNGISLIFSTATLASLKSTPASATPFGSLGAGVGALLPVPVFFGGTIIAGQAYGTEASGIRKSTAAEFNNPDAYVLSDGSGNDRFVPKGGTDAADVGSPLTASEVTSLLQNAFTVMSQARAQIRNPLNSRAEVTITVVDTHGVPLGIVRAPDAPIFGIDVSLQKARTANFFSNPNAASDMLGDSSADSHKADIQNFVTAFRNFLGDPNQLTGKTAFSARAIAGLSRPQFPDGQVGGPTGPFSRPISQFNIFATGLQTALIDQDVANVLGGNVPSRCTFLPDVAPGQNRLQNGIQIFSGGEPIYRNGTLVGGIGVSGDGTSQDDMIGFLGIDGAHGAIATVNNAPPAIRADQLNINQGGGVNHVLYVSCPASPFIGSSVQDPCTGK